MVTVGATRSLAESREIGNPSVAEETRTRVETVTPIIVSATQIVEDARIESQSIVNAPSHAIVHTTVVTLAPHHQSADDARKVHVALQFATKALCHHKRNHFVVTKT